MALDPNMVTTPPPAAQGIHLSGRMLLIVGVAVLALILVLYLKSQQANASTGTAASAGAGNGGDSAAANGAASGGTGEQLYLPTTNTYSTSYFNAENALNNTSSQATGATPPPAAQLPSGLTPVPAQQPPAPTSAPPAAPGLKPVPAQPAPTPPHASPPPGPVPAQHLPAPTTTPPTHSTPASKAPTTPALPPVAPTAHPMPAQHQIVTVGPGDTLSSIAEAHGLNWQQVYQLNQGTIDANANAHGDPIAGGPWNNLFPGEQLVLPS